MSTQAVTRGPTGWETFAGIVLFSVGFFRIISGISYLANSHRVNDFTNGTFNGNLWAYGVWDLCIAALALIAATSLFAGGRFGRFVAYVWCVLVLVQGFLTIGQAPWYSALMITVGLLVTFGLATSGGQAEGDWS